MRAGRLLENELLVLGGGLRRLFVRLLRKPHRLADFRTFSQGRRLRGQILEHPCLTALLQQRPLAGHDSAESAESLLRALVEAGFDRESAARAYTTLLGFVVGVTTLEVRLLEENRDPERREKVREIMSALPADRYPTLVEHTPALRQTVGGDTQFEFGLDLVIAGMEQRLILAG